MPGSFVAVARKFASVLCLLLLMIAPLLLSSCSHKSSSQLSALTTPDVLIIKYHIQQICLDMEEFCRRLYLKNPCYEPDIEVRAEKLKLAFHPQPDESAGQSQLVPAINIQRYEKLFSYQLLEAAFAAVPPDCDRVLLLALGMKKSIVEGYDGHDGTSAMLSGMQLSVASLQRLHANLQQLNWRLKTYRNSSNELIFQTNALGENAYLNMGYEVLMTRMLTRVADDIYLRNGQTPNFVFTMTTMFLPLIL
jgi:hypothetical protein